MNTGAGLPYLGTDMTEACEYDELDRICDQSMKKAEKKCQKFKMGAIAWSVELQQIFDTGNFFIDFS